MPISQITRIPIGRLRPHPSNARTHSRKQIAQIARSIDQFGFIVPIVADEQWFVLAGHGRLQAAKERRLSHVPVIIVSDLSDAGRRAYILADNKLTENAGWDRSALALELNQLAPLLAEADLDLDLTGFHQAELEGLFGDHIDAERDPADQIPSLEPHAVTVTGDLWKLGPHRLLCGDAKSEADLRALMVRERAAMVFTDPPYNVRVNRIQGRGKIKHREFAQASGEMSSAQFRAFLAGTLGLAAKYSVDGSIAFVCMDWRHMAELQDAGKQVYDELKNLIIWTKTNAGQGTFYRSQHELIFVFKNGNLPHINNFELGQHGRTRSNVWSYPGVNTFRTDPNDDLGMHPTVKPVAMVADAMRDCSRPSARIAQN